MNKAGVWKLSKERIGLERVTLSSHQTWQEARAWAARYAHQELFDANFPMARTRVSMAWWMDNAGRLFKVKMESETSERPFDEPPTMEGA